MENEKPVEQSPKPAEPEVTEQSTETLETIAREIPVDEQANQFTAQPQPAAPRQPYAPYAPQPSQEVYTPDPVTDPEGYKRFVVQQMQTTGTIESTIREISSRLNNWEQTTQQQKLDSDVDRAVSRVNQKLKVDPMLAEIALEKMYRSDTNFKRIWDKRDTNPQALERALDVVAGKLAPMFQVRQDPQLAENVRAAQSAQRTMATTEQGGDDIPDDPAQFQAWWEHRKRQG